MGLSNRLIMERNEIIRDGMCMCSLWYGLSITQQVEYNPRHAFLQHENKFWLDPEYHPTMNPGEVLVMFIDKKAEELPDCPEWDINPKWIELDNEGIAELLTKHTKIHVYDIATQQDGILTRNSERLGASDYQ